MRGGDQEARQIGGDRVLKAHVVVLEHRQGDHHHHRPHRHLQADAAPRKRRDNAPTAQHQDVEDDGRADPVAERHREAPGGERLRRRDGDHPGEDRTGAGRVDQSQAGSHRGPRPKALAAPAGHPGAAREPAQPGLQPGGQRRDHQSDPEGDQDEDRKLAQQVVGQAERRDHVNERDDREGEGDSQPDDDPERPAPAAGRAGGERDREDRQHARRDSGDGAGDEPEEHQQCHGLNLSTKALRINDGAQLSRRCDSASLDRAAAAQPDGREVREPSARAATSAARPTCSPIP